MSYEGLFVRRNNALMR